MNPGDELAAVALFPAEAASDQVGEDREGIAGYGAEGDRGAQSDFAGARSGCGEEGGLPVFGDANGEVPGIGCAGFVATQFACGFVHGAVEGVAVDGGGGGVEPEAGRLGQVGDDLVEQARCADAGVVDGFSVGGGVAAVDAASGEIDADVGAFEVLGPVADVESIPVDSVVRRSVGEAREDSDVVPLFLEVGCEHAADLAAAAGEDDAQAGRAGGRNDLHGLRVMPVGE